MDFGYEATQKHDALTDADVQRRSVRVTHAANLRAGADADAAYVQRVFPGTVLEYRGEESGWYKVTSPGGEPAYIFADYAELN